jgi:hypothetical protein
VTSHFDLLNSRDANSVIVVTRAVVATTVAVTGCIGCLDPFKGLTGLRLES